MTIRVAINGFGRIGRNVLRAIYESGKRDQIEVVAINDTSPIPFNAHLFKYDSVHGIFSGDVSAKEEHLMINGDDILMLSDRDPANLDWAGLNVDILMECTGKFNTRETAGLHLKSGAKKVLISSPGGDDVPTVVYGVNDDIITAEDLIVSNASCTTNCLAPVVKPLHEKLGIVRGLMTTVHAYTNDQRLTDSSHKDIRRARSATQSMIPTKTGAAKAVGLVLPELAGKLDGYAVRVPTINVSMVDLTFDAAKATSVAEINAIMQQASEQQPDILGYNELPLVSIDFNHSAKSSTFDATQTRVIDNMVKIVAWYDNEWGFSNRMIDTAIKMGNL